MFNESQDDRMNAPSKAMKKLLTEEYNKIYFKSNFRFLSNHNGYRNGSVHVIQGGAGVGKSTFIRSLLIDLLENNSRKRVGIWLSEETKVSFETHINNSGFPDKFIEKIYYCSDTDNGLNGDVNSIRYFIERNKLDILFLDNITTANMYNTSPSQQTTILSKLKLMTIEKNIPLVIVAHSKKDAQTKFKKETMHDVRGSGTLPNIAEYYYVIQKIAYEEHNNPKRIDLVFIDKSRDYSTNENDTYKLVYHPKSRLYLLSQPIGYDVIREYIKKRRTF